MGTQTLEGDDKIPLHTAKDNLPIFLLEPENTYVVKNKPAVLKCRAANALEVSIRLNITISREVGRVCKLMADEIQSSLKEINK